MSTYFVVEFVDTYVEQGFSGTKNTNLKYIRSRFLKEGTPTGTMKMQVWDSAKTTLIAESNSVKCDFITDPSFVGTGTAHTMSWIRFDFGGQKLETGLTYYARVVPDATYYTGHTDSNWLATIIDYPKPTNDNTDPKTELEGRNFSAYPHLVLEIFGVDYGEMLA